MKMTPVTILIVSILLSIPPTSADVRLMPQLEKVAHTYESGSIDVIAQYSADLSSSTMGLVFQRYLDGHIYGTEKQIAPSSFPDSRTALFEIEFMQDELMQLSGIDYWISLDDSNDQSYRSAKFSVDVEGYKRLSMDADNTLNKLKMTSLELEEERARREETKEMLNELSEIARAYIDDLASIIDLEDIYYTDSEAIVLLRTDKPGRLQVTLEMLSPGNEWAHYDTRRTDIGLHHEVQFDVKSETRYRLRAVAFRGEEKVLIEGAWIDHKKAPKLDFTTQVRAPEPTVVFVPDQDVAAGHDRISGKLSTSQPAIVHVTLGRRVKNTSLYKLIRVHAEPAVRRSEIGKIENYSRDFRQEHKFEFDDLRPGWVRRQIQCSGAEWEDFQERCMAYIQYYQKASGLCISGRHTSENRSRQRVFS